MLSKTHAVSLIAPSEGRSLNGTSAPVKGPDPASIPRWRTILWSPGSLLSAMLLAPPVLVQAQDIPAAGRSTGPYVKSRSFDNSALWRADAEYHANWGLDLSGFDAAYAVGAYGQSVKIGVLDDGTWSGHDEFKTRNNVRAFGGPFGENDTPAISSAGQLLDHGLHVAGIIGANRDGKGMHGGAFLSTIYAGVGAQAGSKLTEPGAARAVIDSGVDFLNSSWGNPFHRTIRYPSPTSVAGNVPEYAIPIRVEVDGSRLMLQHGPDIHASDRVSKPLLPGNRLMLQAMLDIARSGTVNVFAAGNDTYKTALFRGISPAPLTATLPNVLVAGPSWLANDVSTAGDTYWTLNNRLLLANAFSRGIDRYQGLLSDVNALDAETRRDPRIVRLADHLQLLVGPVGDQGTGLEKLAALRSDAAWAQTEPDGLLPLKKLRADFLGVGSLTEADLEKYLANTRELLGGLAPVDKLHPAVVSFQTELAGLAADVDLYKRGKFEPSAEDRAFLQSVRTQGDFRQVEKHWLTVTNVSNDQRISLNSNICGPSKYYCLSAPGGSYSQDMGAPEMPTPEVPAGSPLFDQHGKVLQGTVPAFDYQIFSLGITTDAPAGSSNAEKQAAANSAYHLKGGTSMAAPHATAGLAVIKSRFPYLENAQVRDTLLSTAKDLGAPGIDRVYGWGLMDLEKAMGGPAKFWQLKKDYDLTFAERRAAETYNTIVAKADHFERMAPLASVLNALKNQPLLSDHSRLAKEINQLSQEGRAADDQARSAHAAGDLPTAIRQAALAEARFAEARKKITEAEGIADEIRKNDALANDAIGRARANELTRDHPNEPEDTLAAAFEHFDFRVDLPGERSEACDSEACVADYWSNDIDGPGGLTKLGKGALALTGDNTYEGGTRIESGVLQLGMGGTTGSVIGNIVNNAVLAFHRADEWAFRDEISGTGSLEIYGGTLRLLGDNTYSGDTQINGGLLAVDGGVASRVNVNAGGRLGGGGRVGSLVVRDGGTLALGRSVGALTVSENARFEPGSVFDVKIAADKSESDRLQVLGAVDLRGGTVSVRLEGEAGPLDQPTTEALFMRQYDIITAQQGVTNRFDGVTPQYNYITARLDYGDRNKVVLNFDLTQEAKSETARQKQAELEARERELASLTAPAEEKPPTARPPVEAVLEVPDEAQSVAMPDPTDPLPSQQTTVAPDTASVAGMAAEVQRRKRELLDLRFRELDLLGATTPNQKRVGDSLKSFGLMSGHPLVVGLLASGAGVTPDFDSLSGDLHVSLQSVLPSNSRFVSRLALDRLRLNQNEPLRTENIQEDGPLFVSSPGTSALAPAPASNASAAWVQAYGGRAHADGDGNAAGYRSDSSGFVIGRDEAAGNDWRLGLLASFGSTTLRADTGRASIDTYRLGAYGGSEIQGVGVRLGASFAWHRINTERWAHWLDLTEKNEASYGAMSAEVYGEVGYRMTMQKAVFEPFVGLSHVRLHTEDFEEDGTVTGLAGSSAMAHTSEATIGVQGSRQYAVGEMNTLALRAMVARSRAFGDLVPHASLGFIGGGRFEIQGLPIARERTTFGLGLDAALGGRTRLGVAYTLQLSDGITDSAIKADIQVRF